MKTAQELVDLTPAQLKHWKEFVKAAKAFKKSGGRFYSNLDTIKAYNGNNISGVEGDESRDIGTCFETASVSLESISNSDFCSYADDTHYFTVHDHVEFDADGEGE